MRTRGLERLNAPLEAFEGVAGQVPVSVLADPSRSARGPAPPKHRTC